MPQATWVTFSSSIYQGAERKLSKPKKGLKHGLHNASDPNPNGQPQQKEYGDYKCHFCKNLGHF